MARYRRPLPEFSELLGPRGLHGLPLAGLGQRLAAHLLDGLFYLVFLVPLVLGMPDKPRDDVFLAIPLLLLIPFVIQSYLLATRGQSLGKIALRTRIVDYRTGAHPGFARIVVMRAILPVLGVSMCSLLNLIDALFIFGQERRCLHDLIAGTSVVQADAIVADPSRVFE